jgi:hypothetical protein
MQRRSRKRRTSEGKDGKSKLAMNFDDENKNV